MHVGVYRYSVTLTRYRYYIIIIITVVDARERERWKKRRREQEEEERFFYYRIFYDATSASYEKHFSHNTMLFIIFFSFVLRKYFVFTFCAIAKFVFCCYYY